MFRVVICILLLFVYIKTVVDQLPRLGKRELVCLLLFTCNYVVSVWGGFLGMDYVILLWHSLSLPYNYFTGLIPLSRHLFMYTKNQNAIFDQNGQFIKTDKSYLYI